MNLDAQIEAILYYRNEPTSIQEMAELLGSTREDVLVSIEILKTKLKDRGVALISKEDEISLGTAPEFAELIENMAKKELSADLGKASLDTLTIVLYYGPVTKAQIDNIRGVNSGFILRNLLVRGLSEKSQNDKDQRSFLYKPTFELLAHLGIRQLSDLPEYDDLRKSLEVGLNELEKIDTPNTETQK